MVDYVLSRHGLSRDDLSRKPIKLISSVMLEDPHLYDIVRSSAQHIRDLMDVEFELLYMFGVRSSYAMRRRWTEEMIVREIVQNALDEEAEVRGDKTPKPIVARIGESRWVIADRGRGIKIQHFEIGASEKPCWARGYFGEGLKMSGVAATVIGVPLYIVNRDREVFMFIRDDRTDLVHLAIGYAHEIVNMPVEGFGTAAIIVSGSDIEEMVREMVFWSYIDGDNEDVVKVKPHIEGCRRSEEAGYAAVYIGEGNRLWVRDIYVNYVSDLTGKKSLFSYNLWNVDLDPNRTNIANTSKMLGDLAETLGRAIVEKPIVLENILNTVHDISRGMLGGADYIELSILSDTLIGDEVKKVSKEVLERKLRQWGYDAYGYIGSSSAIFFAENYLKLRVLKVGYSIYNYLRNLAPDLDVERVTANRVREMTEHREAESKITFRQYINLASALVAFSNILDSMSIKFVKPVKMGAAGAYDPVNNIIKINISEMDNLSSLISTLHHEISHALAHKRYEDFNDLTRGFEKAMSDVAGMLVLGSPVRAARITSYLPAVLDIVMDYDPESGFIKNIKNEFDTQILDILIDRLVDSAVLSLPDQFEKELSLKKIEASIMELIKDIVYDNPEYMPIAVALGLYEPISEIWDLKDKKMFELENIMNKMGIFNMIYTKDIFDKINMIIINLAEELAEDLRKKADELRKNYKSIAVLYLDYKELRYRSIKVF